MRWAAYLVGLIGWVNFIAWTLILGVGLLVVWPFDPTRVRMARVMRACWGRGLMWANPGWRVKRVGRVHGEEGPFVVVSNHQSMIDIPSVLAQIPPVRIVARDRIFRAPILGAYLRLTRQINADHFESEGLEALRAGHSLLVFAEGTRSVDGTLGRLRNGAFHLARAAGVPVLPVVIEGSRWVMPRGGLLPTRVRPEVRVQTLPPVEPTAYDSTPELKRAVHAMMARALEAA